MAEYKQFLADQILTDGSPVTYRLLSRSLKVHVNTAKEMLFDFHKTQNAMRADTVRATYLVYGVQGSQNGDGDVQMSSSVPEVESLSEEAPSATVMLVPEERLEKALEGFESVASIHIYSLGPHAAKDRLLLSDVNRQLVESGAAYETEYSYSSVTNSKVRKRDRKGQPVMPAAPVQQKPAQPKSVSKSATETVKKEATSSSSGAKKPAPSKAPSGIMSSFAKAAAKPKTEKKAAPQPDTQNAALSDDGEDDSEPVPHPGGTSASQNRKSRQQREEELRRMMEVEDEEPEEKSEPSDEEMEDAEEPPLEPEQEQAEAARDEEPAEVATTGADGRRRGRRRVMKKKQIMDEKGYLVTVQEAGWESFSEDEPAIKAKKPAPAPSAPPKAKKPAPKGQGNIMSFFGKK